MNKIIVCNNCGKQGHMFNQCKLPIISYGVILFTTDSNNDFKYLMIRRKDSFGYIDFVRGKYSPYNISQIQDLIDQMSINEKNRILNTPFIELWNQMWGTDIQTTQHKSEENVSYKKFDIIQNGISIDNKFIDLKHIIDNSTTCWEETEWEFPKGRRNPKEKDLDCALREFEEETGISKTSITVITNVMPFEEIFIGTNYKSYKHKYFLAHTTELDSKYLQNFQVTEVSKLEWKTLDECLKSIRPYNLEKKNLINQINKVLRDYKLY